MTDDAEVATQLTDVLAELEGTKTHRFFDPAVVREIEDVMEEVDEDEDVDVSS